MIEVELPGARVRFTDRHGGVSAAPYATLNLGDHVGDDPEAVAENRRRVADGAVLQVSRQVHGAALSETGGGEADGQVVRRGAGPERAAMVLVADCLPIALAGPDGVAMLHAGWRGLTSGIIARGVQALGGVDAAAIGPGAGGCCYEVGPEVHAVFGTSGRTLDLKAVAAQQLREAGVRHVHDTGRCTMCDETFFSHRREHGRTGRQAGIAWIA